MGPNKNPKKNTNDPSRIVLYSTLLNILVAGTKGTLTWLKGHIVQEEKILRNPYLKEEKGKGIN